MSPRRIFIGFRGCQVAVRSDDLEVCEGLHQSFHLMIETPSTPIVGQVSVDREDGVYHVWGGMEPSVHGGTLADALRCARYHIARHLVEATPELLWFHAAAASRDGLAVMLSGSSGRGKSTLVTRLCARNWRFLTDEAVAFETPSSSLVPFPQAPTPRVEPEAELPAERLGELAKTEIMLAPESVCREPQQIAAVIFPCYAPGSPTELQPCTTAEAAAGLLENCVNFSRHGERAVQHVCALAARVPAFRLVYSDRDLAAAMIDETHDRGWRHGRFSA